MFRSYSEMIEWFLHRTRKAEMDRTLLYLQDQVEVETEELVRQDLNERSQNNGRPRRSKRLINSCRSDAQKHFVEEKSP